MSRKMFCLQSCRTHLSYWAIGPAIAVVLAVLGGSVSGVIRSERQIGAAFDLDAHNAGTASDSDEYHDKRVLIRFKPNTPQNLKLAAHLKAKYQFISKDFDVVSDLHLVELLEGQVETALKVYQTDPNVLYAEPDYKLQLLEIPNDPNFDLLWGLQNTGQSGEGFFCYAEGTPGADIRALKAWDYWTGDQDFRIAVIDTGVDYNHPDLIDNIWTNPGETPGNGIDDDGNGYVDDVHGYDFGDDDSDPLDDNHYHGTHVAGTIGASGNNGVGVTGVNWRCSIVALKFRDSDGNLYTSNAIEAIEYVMANNIRVSNNSWGGRSFSQALYDAIEASQSVGHIFVAAAGNDWSGNNDLYPLYPSAYDLPNIIAVAATDNRDNRAAFSNVGRWSVDLGAPGTCIYSTLPEAEYGYLDGTSMATPHVTGVVGLVMSRHPNLTWQQVKERIIQTVRPNEALEGLTVTAGLVNAGAAVWDCNDNDIPDEQDIAEGTSDDCNNDLLPDECQPDCNDNGVADSCDITAGTSADCSGNGIPDECEPDCNQNSVVDSCDLQDGTSEDCDFNGIPDDCEPDCNNNGTADFCDVFYGVSENCNRNFFPDECEPELEVDCNSNGSPDVCDIIDGISPDCNDNEVPDECDIANGTAQDSDGDGILDECVGRGVSLLPVSASGDYYIEDNRIILAEARQTVTLELRVNGWDPDLDGDPLLRAYEANIESAGFDSGMSGSLSLMQGPCTTFTDCFGNAECGESGLCDARESVTIDSTHQDYVFQDVVSITVTGPNEFPPGFKYVGVVPDRNDSVIDPGVARYAGTLILDVPPDAVGTFTIAFEPGPDGVLLRDQAPFGGAIAVPSRTPGLITIASDCNLNGIPDHEDTENGSSADCNHNGIPDECEPDCNDNDIADSCDLAEGASQDCNSNSIPDECDPDQDLDGITDDCDNCPAHVNPEQEDCNGDGNGDVCVIAEGASMDCNDNGIPDDCLDLEKDCNANEVPDECDLAKGTSADCNDNGIPDDCLDIEEDCNSNEIPDECDIAEGINEDCDSNGIPDDCDPDCNDNGIADICDLVEETSVDLNHNDVPDECEITIYVDNDGQFDPGSGDPTQSDPDEDGSQDHPYDAIQEAIDAAGDFEDKNPDRSYLVQIVVADGTYSGPGNRDINFHGKPYTLRSEQGSRTCTIDCQGTRDDFHRGFVFQSGENYETRVEGFTITHGVSDFGGAIYCLESSPTISNCIITENSSMPEGIPSPGSSTETNNGGGIYSKLSSPAILDCQIIGNSSQANGGGVYYKNSNVTIRNSTVMANSAADKAGGIWLSRSPGIITHSLVAGNISSDLGGGIYCKSGGDLGGGFSVGFDRVPKAGGGVTINNCTITGNTADSGGGMYLAGSTSNVRLTNSILWNNSAGSGNEIYQSSSSNLTVTHSDVQGGTVSVAGSEIPIEGTGNINRDPLFVPGPSGDYYLSQIEAGQQTNSPCVDAGSGPKASLELASLTTRTDEILDTGIVDMGYHYPIDCNENGIPDYQDIAAGTSKDRNRDGIPDECSYCLFDYECDDEVFCNGAEFCLPLLGCQTSEPPCWGMYCDEKKDECAQCLMDSHCDDGYFCNGIELCAAGQCTTGEFPCEPDQLCDEIMEQCSDYIVSDNGNENNNENGGEEVMLSVELTAPKSIAPAGQVDLTVTAYNSSSLDLNNVALFLEFGQFLKVLDATGLGMVSRADLTPYSFRWLDEDIPAGESIEQTLTVQLSPDIPEFTFTALLETGIKLKAIVRHDEDDLDTATYLLGIVEGGPPQISPPLNTPEDDLHLEQQQPVCCGQGSSPMAVLFVLGMAFLRSRVRSRRGTPVR